MTINIQSRIDTFIATLGDNKDANAKANALKTALSKIEEKDITLAMKRTVSENAIDAQLVGSEFPGINAASVEVLKNDLKGALREKYPTPAETEAQEQANKTRDAELDRVKKVQDESNRLKQKERSIKEAPPLTFDGATGGVIDTVSNTASGLIGWLTNDSSVDGSGIGSTIKSIIGYAKDTFNSITSEGTYGRYIGKAAVGLASWFGFTTLAGFIPGLGGTWFGTIAAALGAAGVTAISYKDGVNNGNTESLPNTIREQTDSTLASVPRKSQDVQDERKVSGFSMPQLQPAYN